MKIYSQIVLGGCKTKYHWIICSRRLWGAFCFSNTNSLTSHTLYPWHANDLTLVRLCRRGSSCSQPAPCDTPSASLFSRTSCKANIIRHLAFLRNLLINCKYYISHIIFLRTSCNIKYSIVKKTRLASDENHARYWSEWESRTIYKADKFSGKNVTAITGHLVTPQ